MRRFSSLPLLLLAFALPAAAGPASTLRLESLSVADPMVGGDEAFSLLVPKGWRHEGGVLWQQQYSNLATGQFRVFDPNGAGQLEIFPAIPFVWADGGIAFFPPGSVYLGNVVQPPPRSAHDFVRDAIIPRYRESARSLRIVSRERLAGRRARPLAGRRSVRHHEHGPRRASPHRIHRSEPRDSDRRGHLLRPHARDDAVDARIRALVARASLRLPREKGKLDAEAPLLQAMVASMKISLGWFAKYGQVHEMS